MEYDFLGTLPLYLSIQNPKPFGPIYLRKVFSEVIDQKLFYNSWKVLWVSKFFSPEKIIKIQKIFFKLCFLLFSRVLLLVGHQYSAANFFTWGLLGPAAVPLFCLWWGYVMVRLMRIMNFIWCCVGVGRIEFGNKSL